MIRCCQIFQAKRSNRPPDVNRIRGRARTLPQSSVSVGLPAVNPQDYRAAQALSDTIASD